MADRVAEALAELELCVASTLAREPVHLISVTPSSIQSQINHHSDPPAIPNTLFSISNF